ncbi:MAG: 30S ribosomal protein S3 [Candidatus Peregrinibacteria bacterium GW2011_GWA2_47_7]|nr:MAG: 30S ribosomal protein S3 [Candidatus Peregrinibacteria bacterium GW2011_GWA2_47_7]
MGQKVNPVGLRIGINKTWDSKWYANKQKYTQLLHQDLEIRKLLLSKLKEAGVSRIEIHRTSNHVILKIHTSRPGIVIGSQGALVEDLKSELERKFNEKFQISIQEIKKPYLDAYLLAEMIGKQIERRIPYRRACKMSVERSMEAGARGVKIHVCGRLNGVEISRGEFFSSGRIPLHTFRADIDYACYHAPTSYGTIGVKVWIYRGDVYKKD